MELQMDELEILALKSLKEISGAGLHDCKRALNQYAGDRAKALLELIGENKNKMLELIRETPPSWVLEALAGSKFDEVIFAVSNHPSTPKTIAEKATSETVEFSNRQEISHMNIEIFQLRQQINKIQRQVNEIQRAYNALASKLAARDKEIFEELGRLSKNVNAKSYNTSYHVTFFETGEF
jgi:predicted RNase H-like nuclease (RuvC/YqgF family)